MTASGRLAALSVAVAIGAVAAGVLLLRRRNRERDHVALRMVPGDRDPL